MAYTKEVVNALPIGTVVKGLAYSYTIRKVLGQGTFGITYLASVKMSGALGSLDTEVLVAIKEFFMKELNGREESTVTSSSKDGAFAYYKSKFIHEAENLSRLKHSNIIKVVESFEENNTAYYAMEYIEGGSLDDRIAKSNGLSEGECVNYTHQIGKALEYMHSQKMLHLDLKPNNIMLHKNGQIVLIDFGLAKQFGADGKPETSTTIGHGTPGYAPIEQANYRENKFGVFPATMDIYAFGATIFKMLTGHRPPEASSILNDGFPVEEFQNLHCSQSLMSVIQKSMSPLKKDRYQNVTSILAEINGLSNGKNNTKGHYTKIIGEAEYGTEEQIKVPVTDSIDFPFYIDIKLWKKDKNGLSYQFILSDGCFEDDKLGEGIYNIARIWHNGLLVDEHSFGGVIPNDVKEYLIEHGFLSTTHWENESRTTPIGDDFGYDVSIRMQGQKIQSKEFVRRVENAHPDWHNILLNEINDLVRNTSLSDELLINSNYRNETYDPTISPIILRDDTDKIEVAFSPRTPSVKGSYTAIIKRNDILICAFGVTYLATESKINSSYVKQQISESTFKSIQDFIGKLNYIPDGKTMHDLEHSEDPTTLKIKLYTNGNCYASYISQSIGWNHYGNLCGNANILNEGITRLIPKFDYLLHNAELQRDTILNTIDKEKNTESNKNDSEENGSSPKKKNTVGDAIGMTILFSLIVVVFATPTFLFISSNDKYFAWLYGSLSLTEIAIFMISFGGLSSKNGESTKCELAGGIVGIVAGLAYIILWICQMCSWWL